MSEPKFIPQERILLTQSSDPAAGAEASITVPAGKRWVILSADITLVTSSTAANRECTLKFTDGTTTFLYLPAGYTHTASLTRQYMWALLSQRVAATVATMRLEAMPFLVLSAGYTISTATTNLQTTDDYGKLTLVVLEIDY